MYYVGVPCDYPGYYIRKSFKSSIIAVIYIMLFVNTRRNYSGWRFYRDDELISEGMNDYTIINYVRGVEYPQPDRKIFYDRLYRRARK